MLPKPVFSHAQKTQKGSLTLIAVFVIVILTLLGLSLADQIRSGSQNVVYEVHGTRALMAAKTGLELMAAQSFPVGGIDQACNLVETTVDVSTIAGLENCSFIIRCNTQTVSQNSVPTHNVYRFESTGVCQASAQWASRTVAQEAVVRL
jgi:MSHA biogenesis protein MshP